MARLAAPRVSKQQLDRLLGICSDGEGAVRDSDIERFSSANYGFHAAFAELAGNSVLAQLWRVVAQRARWHYHKVVPVRMRDSCAEHQEIARAIAARDEGRAAGAAQIHMERTRTAYHRDQVGS